MMLGKWLCVLGVHRWKLVYRSFYADKLYWESHGVLPDDVAVCVWCGKHKVVKL